MKWTKGDMVSLNFNLLWDNGTSIDLTDATVDFILTNVDTDIEFLNSSATIITPTEGLVQYSWGIGETDTLGLYQMKWKITYSTGKTYTVPNNIPEYIHIR